MNKRLTRTNMGRLFNRPYNLLFINCLIFASTLQFASAQEQGTLTPKILAPLKTPENPKTPAKELFGRATIAAPLTPESIGFYSKGCLAGGVALPINGKYWQAMRLSRNRNWGNPTLITFLEIFSEKAVAVSGWPGILVGDMSQPRGGPMLTGHASHQVGLDADIWLMPMPAKEYTLAERETVSSTNMVRADRKDINPETWTNAHLAVIREAALNPSVQRIFVNAAIKRAMCRTEAGQPWMSKVRPMYKHDYHFHVRLFCPQGDKCTAQEAMPEGDGCDKSLDWWFSDVVLNPKPVHPTPAPKPPLTMASLPAQCRAVLDAK
jgi:penicillin-insensitive murein endopeptidase